MRVKSMNCLSSFRAVSETASEITWEHAHGGGAGKNLCLHTPLNT